METLTFYGDAQLKKTYLARAKKHREDDDFIKGTYGKAVGATGWKGCAIGCLAHSGTNSHEALSRQIGIPLWLAYLIDSLFEALPEASAKMFPARFIEALPVGTDLTIVYHQFLHWLLVDPAGGVIRFVQGDIDEQQRKAIEGVASLHLQAINGEAVSAAAWAAASAAAWDAARDAAWDAASAAARDAASAAASEKLLELLADKTQKGKN